MVDSSNGLTPPKSEVIPKNTVTKTGQVVSNPLNPTDAQPVRDQSIQTIQKTSIPEHVEKLGQQLADEFMATYKQIAGEALSGTLEESSRFHAFIFSKTVALSDREARDEMNEAHMALVLEHNKTPQIISSFGDRVGKSGHLLRDIVHSVYQVERMIPDGAELAKGERGEALVILSQDMRAEFGKFTEYYLEVNKLLEGVKLLPNVSREQMAVFMAAQRVAEEYFKRMTDGSSIKNAEKYKNDRKKARLADFRGSGSAVCTEFGALTHQLLSYAGLKTMLVSGGPLMMVDEDGRLESPGYERHVYAVTEGQNGLETPNIYDPANPLVMSQTTADPNAQPYLIPFVAPLSNEEYKTFLNGYDVVVSCGGISRGYSRIG